MVRRGATSRSRRGVGPGAPTPRGTTRAARRGRSCGARAPFRRPDGPRHGTRAPICRSSGTTRPPRSRPPAGPRWARGRRRLPRLGLVRHVRMERGVEHALGLFGHPAGRDVLARHQVAVAEAGDPHLQVGLHVALVEPGQLADEGLAGVHHVAVRIEQAELDVRGVELEQPIAEQRLGGLADGLAERRVHVVVAEVDDRVVAVPQRGGHRDRSELVDHLGEQHPEVVELLCGRLLSAHGDPPQTVL